MFRVTEAGSVWDKGKREYEAPYVDQLAGIGVHDQVDEEPGRILVEVLVLVGGCHVDGLGVGLVDVFTEVAAEFREE